MEKMISVKNLRKTYKKPSRSDLETAVENVSFDLIPGSIMGLWGQMERGKRPH